MTAENSNYSNEIDSPILCNLHLRIKRTLEIYPALQIPFEVLSCLCEGGQVPASGNVLNPREDSRLQETLRLLSELSAATEGLFTT